MKLFKSKEKRSESSKKLTEREKRLQQGVFSATAVGHTYYKAGARDGSLGGAQKIAVLRMLQDEDK